jgi:uncharacterized membrane protein YczE
VEVGVMFVKHFKRGANYKRLGTSALQALNVTLTMSKELTV